MKDEYIIINKTDIQKRIEEWESELQECFKAPIGKFNSDYVSTLQQAIATARDILSQSTPLIPEIEKHSIAFVKSLLNCTVSRAISINNIEKYHPKEYQLLLGELELHGEEIFKEYIANLKLDI